MILIQALKPADPPLPSAAPISQGPSASKRVPGACPLDHQIGFLYVLVSLAGRPTQWFILDTGSYRSYLTARGLDRLKKSGLIPRVNGETNPLKASISGVALGEASFTLDTNGFPASLDPEADGIIGLDLLAKNRFGIDVARREFRVWPSGTGAQQALRDWFVKGTSTGSTHLWAYGDHTYAVYGRIANLTLPLCVDTGSEESYLSRELAPALRPNLRMEASRATFYTGPERVAYYRVDRLGLEDAPLAARRIGTTSIPNVPGLLGADVLGRMRLLFDFPGERLYFSKPSASSPKATAPLHGPSVDLPTDVTIDYPKREVVRVEPGCDYDAPKGYRTVHRPDGTLDLVPPGMRVPPFRPKPPLLLAPTVDRKPYWVDRPAHVPPRTPYTAPPGWRKLKRPDGSIDLYPPVSSKGPKP